MSLQFFVLLAEAAEDSLLSEVTGILKLCVPRQLLLEDILHERQGKAWQS